MSQSWVLYAGSANITAPNRGVDANSISRARASKGLTSMGRQPEASVELLLSAASAQVTTENACRLSGFPIKLMLGQPAKNHQLLTLTALLALLYVCCTDVWRPF
jgi:hypothetical protein